MNKSVEDTFVEDDLLEIDSDSYNANEKTSGLKTLTEAIRNSIIFFVIAALALTVVTFILIKQFQLDTNLYKLKIQVETLQGQTNSMKIHEKDFANTGSTAAEVDFRTEHQAASETIANMLQNPSISEEETLIANRTKSRLDIYKTQFDEIVTVIRKKGLDFDSGILGDLNTTINQLTLDVETASNASFSDSSDFRLFLTQLNSVTNDYLFSQNEVLVKPIIESLDNLKQSIIDNDGIATNLKSDIVNGVDKYSGLLNEYQVLNTTSARLLKDTSIAANATVFPLSTFIEAVNKRQEPIERQIFTILVVAAIFLVLIFAVVAFQLLRAQRASTQTLEDTRKAQAEAEKENEQLNDSVISILESVSLLSHKDLTARAPVTEDVIGTVSDSINLLADETSSVLKGVTGIATQVSLVSDSVHNQAEQVSLTAEEERKSVQQMVETLFGATQTMNQVAALAEQSNESAAEATDITENALRSVTQTVDGMENIRETIAETEKRIKRLGERSQEISGIVNLINTISERTHVLALNASMQAAVAGEAGRGFAVVAEEVQQLAESSRNATEQIATLVNNIQIETNETINTVNRTISQVVDGSEQATQAGEQMRKTQEVTAQLVSRVQEIAQASRKQKAMSGELLEAIQAIGEGTEKTAQQIAAQNAGTEELQAAAKSLMESVSVFKLPQ